MTKSKFIHFSDHSFCSSNSFWFSLWQQSQLRNLGRKKRGIFNQSCIGKEFSILTEGWESGENNRIKGLSDNYLSVVFPSSELITNKIVKVRIETIQEDRIIGRPKWEE